MATPPAFRSKTNKGYDTTPTANKPTGTVSTDVMLAWIQTDGTPTLTGPSGWTNAARILSPDGTTFVQDLWYKVAGGSEPSSYTWGGAGGAGITIDLYTYSGADTTTPIPIVGTPTQTTGTTVSALGITTVTTDNRLVALYSAYDALGWTQPTGMTERSDVGGGLAMDDTTKTTPGSTGNKDSTHTGAAQKVAILISLQPPQITLSDPPMPQMRLPMAIVAR